MSAQHWELLSWRTAGTLQIQQLLSVLQLTVWKLFPRVCWNFQLNESWKTQSTFINVSIFCYLKWNTRTEYQTDKDLFYLRTNGTNSCHNKWPYFLRVPFAHSKFQCAIRSYLLNRRTQYTNEWTNRCTYCIVWCYTYILIGGDFQHSPRGHNSYTQLNIYVNWCEEWWL